MNDGFPDLFGTPTVGELLEAVREFLVEEIAPVVDAQVRYQVRIAANVIAIIERELIDGPLETHAHQGRLASLGFDSDESLASALRDGACDDDSVVAALREDTLARVRVANPAHIADERTG